LRGLLSRTDRKGDSKLGYNFTASLFICWQIKWDTKNMSSFMQNIWKRENFVYTFCGFLKPIMKEISNRIFHRRFSEIWNLINPISDF
jgi:hypothetical protein